MKYLNSSHVHTVRQIKVLSWCFATGQKFEGGVVVQLGVICYKLETTDLPPPTWCYLQQTGNYRFATFERIRFVFNACLRHYYFHFHLCKTCMTIFLSFHLCKTCMTGFLFLTKFTNISLVSWDPSFLDNFLFTKVIL